MDRYFSAGLVSSTQRVYTAGSRRYLELCNLLSTPAIPTSENLLCKFVAFLALNNVSSSTIKVYLPTSLAGAAGHKRGTAVSLRARHTPHTAEVC